MWFPGSRAWLGPRRASLMPAAAWSVAAESSARPATTSLARALRHRHFQGGGRDGTDKAPIARASKTRRGVGLLRRMPTLEFDPERAPLSPHWRLGRT